MVLLAEFFKSGAIEQAVLYTLSLVVSGSLDVFESTNHSHLTSLQTTVPILTRFLHSSERDERGKPCNEVCDILKHILKVCQAPFKDGPPSSSLYSAIHENKIAFFPSLPKLLGPANYLADTTKHPSRASDSCRKESYGHPSLSPGIFTIFCPHGINFVMGLKLWKLASHRSTHFRYSELVSTLPLN